MHKCLTIYTMSSILTLSPYVGVMARQIQATRSYSSTQDPAMQRAHRIRLNPTPEQQAYFRKAAGTARFVYNWGLSEVKRALDGGRTPATALELKARFNALKREQFPWVYEVSKCAVEGAFRNLGTALANFRASKRGEHKGRPMGFPKFKRKKRGAGSFYLANDKF